jgi:hypothetical protein
MALTILPAASPLRNANRTWGDCAPIPEARGSKTVAQSLQRWVAETPFFDLFAEPFRRTRS